MPVVLATELKKLFIKSDVAGCMTHVFFFSEHHGFNCLSFIWATDIGKQCKNKTGPGKKDAPTGRVPYVCDVFAAVSRPQR